jgi:predicted amidophosphoribosyltransferase
MLVTCPECSAEISEMADPCPKCGLPGAGKRAIELELLKPPKEKPKEMSKAEIDEYFDSLRKKMDGETCH